MEEFYKKTSIKTLSGKRIVCNNGDLKYIDNGKVKSVYCFDSKEVIFLKCDYKSLNYDFFAYNFTYKMEKETKKMIFENGVTGFCIDLSNVWNLEQISISKTVKKISLDDVCEKLKKITVDKKSKFFCFKNGVLFNKNRTVLYRYLDNKGKGKKTYSIPKTVKRIEPYAFACNKKLKIITMPDSVKKIGSNSFSDCKSLNKIKISNKLKVIPASAFFCCKKLKKVIGFKKVKTNRLASICWL